MDKFVLITGAAGGLGQSLTKIFHQNGWKVVATDLLPMAQDEHFLNSGIRVFQMDVTSNESVTEVFKQLNDEKICIQLIINNAGIDSYFPLSEKKVEHFQKIFEVNVFGAYRVNQVFLPILQKPGGKIIHIGSESLNLTVPFMPYPLSKKLLEGYARVLRLELKFYGIDVTVVRPGAIKTPLLEQVKNLWNKEQSQFLKKPFDAFSKTAGTEIGKTITPWSAARFIYQIASMPRTRHLYRINNTLKLRIAAWLPYKMVENYMYQRLSRMKG